jgi:hypothetical protein
MADHKSYMHKSYPSSSNNEHTPHLTHLASVTHEDPHLRQRGEPTGHDGGTGSGGSGAGGGARESINKGTI